MRSNVDMESAKATSSENGSGLRREMERLKADFERLRSDLSGLTEDSANTVRAGAAEAKERVCQGARAAVAKGRDCAAAIGDQVTAHPFMALGAALAVGLVAGVAISRKD
jgi:ElaB/YqjD/DUF883 family membrane-anchored ribosome-binding protein